MDNFEKLFKENKSSFDRLEPSVETWHKISNEMGQKTSKQRFSWSKRIKYIGMAATILIGILTASIYNSNKDSSIYHNISLASPDGKLINLDPSANKLTLVQFWESGNMLCSEDNCYYYLPAYKKYKNLGFEIYAISLDNDHKAWIDGIEENQLPWIHVSDLKGWASPICIECNISKVPSSILLDNKGQIVAKDLDARLLEMKLDELLVQN